jgi:hypothetical protein
MACDVAQGSYPFFATGDRGRQPQFRLRLVSSCGGSVPPA